MKLSRPEVRTLIEAQARACSIAASVLRVAATKTTKSKRDLTRLSVRLRKQHKRLDETIGEMR